MAESSDGSDADSVGGSSDTFLREAARVDSAPPPSTHLALGTRLGRFLVREELGRGGMGIVYRARDEKLGRTVALKILPTRRESDPDRRSRFVREGRAAASIVHPNVAMVYEIGEAGTSLYIAMELISGTSLRDRFGPRHPLPVAEVVRIAKGILRGLAAAHGQGVVHRDLKPENVMIDAEGEPKILDFGLAKLLAADETSREILEHQPTEAASTEEGRLLGTPSYMSPEQAKGKPVDARSDLFSLGSVLYEALAGRRPFVGETSVETLAAVMRDEPTPIRRLSPNVPAELAGVVMRCLAKSPSDRPASAAELLELLEGLGQGAARRRRVRIGVGIGAALAFCAVTVAAFSHFAHPVPSAAMPAPVASSAAAMLIVTEPALAFSAATPSVGSLPSSTTTTLPDAGPPKPSKVLRAPLPSAARPLASAATAPDPLADQK